VLVAQDRQAAVDTGCFRVAHATVLDPENEGFEVAAVDAAMMAQLMSFPLPVLPDPWDRTIVATALHLGVPVVTKDRAIAAAGVAETIW
jgi:PIN domain nuclease of toxin-antitoxin system